MSECPSENLLAAYIDRCLALKQQWQIEEHMAECCLCRGTVVLAIKSKKIVPDPAPSNSIDQDTPS